MEDLAQRETDVWKRLLHDCRPRLEDGKYCAARGIRGSMYSEGGVVFVGRALNYWPPTMFTKDDIATDQSLNVVVERIRSLKLVDGSNACELGMKCGPLHWVHHSYDWPPWSQSKRKTTTAKLGSFWPSIGRIVRSRHQLGDESHWAEWTCWTNLYPVSHETGNPRKSLSDDQRTASCELVRIALESWQPSTAVFLTQSKGTWRNTGWFFDFAQSLGIDEFRHSESDAIVGTGLFRAGNRDSKVVVTVRPEGFRGGIEAFAKAVLDEIQ